MHRLDARIVMKIDNLVIYIALIALMLLVSCKQEVERGDADITLVYTTDVHGRMLNYDFLQQKDMTESLSNVMTFVKQCRKENPGGTILVDNGDLIEGCPSMYYYNYVDIRREHLATRVLNYMGYDVVNIGNHDLECGEAVYYDHLKKGYSMDLLCANAIDSRTGEPMFLPYCIMERKGYKIAILGMVTADVSQLIPRTAIPHLRFESIRKTAERWIPIIEKDEQPDLIVGLIHAGHESVSLQDEEEKDYLDGALVTAREVRGFDVLFIGHDHQVMQDTIINQFGDTIPVLQPAHNCKEVGRMDLHVTQRLKDNGHAYAEYRMARIPTSELETDAEFNQTFQDEIGKINSFLDRSIEQPIAEMDGLKSLTGPSDVMDLIHAVQLSTSYAHVSMASCLNSFGKIQGGTLSMRQLFAIYKYENQMTKMWMTGSEIRKFLEFGYGRQFNQMKSASDHLLNFRLKANGDTIMGRFGPELVTPQYNFTSAAGINYEVDVRKPVGQRVSITSMADGSPFDPQRRYDVVLSSYQAAGGGGFLRQGLGWDTQEIERRTIRTTTKDMRYFIRQYLISLSNGTRPPVLGSWEVVPTAWWVANRDRDAKLLEPYIK